MLMGKLLCAMDPTLPEGDFHRRRSAQSQVKYQARAQMFNGAGCNWIVHYNRGISKLVCWGTGGHCTHENWKHADQRYRHVLEDRRFWRTAPVSAWKGRLP
jgi:hypothetical protein